MALRKKAPTEALVDRVGRLDWERISRELDDYGNALLPQILAPEKCDGLAEMYPDDRHFRSRVVMERYSFGRGEYKYFQYPLPGIISDLRTALYLHLAPVANRWNEALAINVRYPEEHDDYIRRCHQAGQLRPTPLLLQYGPDDYNCLHQDLYGEHVFPLQIAILLDQPGEDFAGGEFVMTEQRPRMQTRPMVLPL